MQDAFKQRQQQLGALKSSVRANDRDDELALFLEMRNREKERGDLVLRAAEDFDAAAALGMNTVDNTFFFCRFVNFSANSCGTVVSFARCDMLCLTLSLAMCFVFQAQIRAILPCLTFRLPWRRWCERLVLMIFSIRRMIRMIMTGIFCLSF